MESQLNLIRGKAGQALEGFAEVVVHDIYDALGSKLYDAVATQDAHELREMLAIVRRTNGPILELACGAGRFTLPLLSLGRPVTAVDLSPSMLGILSKRIDSDYPQLKTGLSLVEADICTLEIESRFETIIFGCVTISLLNEESRNTLFANMHRLLTPQGRLFMSTTVVEGHNQLSQAGDPVENSQKVQDSTGATYHLHEYIVPDRTLREITLIPETVTANGPVDIFTTKVRVIPPPQLAQELEASGLRVVKIHPVKTPGFAHEIVILEVAINE